MTDLRARLTALEREMRSYLGPSWPPNMQSGERVKMWADELAALLREPPAGPVCIACGESQDGGYEVEDGPGPFCAGCWERLEEHFAEDTYLLDLPNA